MNTYPNPKILVVIVALNRIAIPLVKRGIAVFLDLVTVAIRLEPLGLGLVVFGGKVGHASPLNAALTLVGVDAAKPQELDAALGHSHDLGEVGDASLIAAGADEDVADLGTIDDGGGRLKRGGDDSVIHYVLYLGSFYRKVKNLVEGRMIFAHHVNVKVSSTTGSPIGVQVHDVHVAQVLASRNPVEHPFKRGASRNRPRTTGRATRGAAPAAHELVLGNNAPDVSVLLLVRAVIDSSSVHIGKNGSFYRKVKVLLLEPSNRLFNSDKEPADQSPRHHQHRTKDNSQLEQIGLVGGQFVHIVEQNKEPENSP